MGKMMIRALLLASLVGANPLVPPVSAQPGVNAGNSAGAGTAQRRAILDALRPVIQRELGGRVEFVVRNINVQGGWALVVATPQRPGGGAIPAPASWAREAHDGMDVNALLRFRGGRWTLVDHAIGPTDVWACGLQGPPASLTRC
jgi:hypothetical protein